MKKLLKRYLPIFILAGAAASLLLFKFSFADTIPTLSPWYYATTSTITTRTTSTIVRVPELGGGGTLCIHTDNSGNLGTSTADCGSGSGGVQSVVAGTNIGVNNTDPANPIVSFDGSGSVSIATLDVTSGFTSDSTASFGPDQTLLVDPGNHKVQVGPGSSLYLYNADASGKALLNVAGITTDRTFTYPDASGTLCLTTTCSPIGNYITALTGDGTATGPGSVAFTLATVNSNAGTFGSSTTIPVFTVNGKGLITAAQSTSTPFIQLSSISGTSPILYNSSTGVFSFATTSVTAGSYTNTSLTVDQFGRITAASSGSGGGGGSISTSSAITAGYFPYWSAASGTLSGTSTIFVATSTGNVGIATNTPATALDINGVTTFRGNIIAGTDNVYDIGASGATRPRTGYFGTSLYSPLLSVGTTTAPAAGVAYFNGNVGIGVKTPTQLLHVNGGNILIQSGSDTFTLSASNGSGEPEINMFNAGLFSGTIVGDTDTLLSSQAFVTSVGMVVTGNLRNTGKFFTSGSLTSAPTTWAPANSTSGVAELASIAGSPNFISFNEAGVAFRGTLGFPGGSGDLVYSSGGTGTFNTGTELFRIANTGKVGINKSSPAANLHVQSNAAANIGLIVQATTSQSASLTQWRDSSAAVLSSVDSSGKFGIGNSAPSSTLHVSGNVQFSSSSTITTASIGGGALLAGACSSATSTIDSTVASSSAAFITTPQIYPGGSFDWRSYLTGSGVLTTEVCASVAGTPTSTAYNVKIIK